MPALPHIVSVNGDHSISREISAVFAMAATVPAVPCTHRGLAADPLSHIDVIAYTVGFVDLRRHSLRHDRRSTTRPALVPGVRLGMFPGMGSVEIRRVYDAGAVEGTVFLVDRVWPRGIRKSDLEIDGWLREVAPSADLRKWFGHRPERFAEFRARYRRELDDHPDAVRPLLDAARQGSVTLLYSARDTEHNQAVVLREYLCDRLM